jgi:hypothetical protein
MPRDALRRATIILTADTGEYEQFDAWSERWTAQLTFHGENEGCGCCVNIYHITAPAAALNELPAHVRSDEADA